MNRRLSLLVMFAGVVLTARPIVAADHPLEAIPDGAGVLLRLQAPQATMQKVAGLAGKLNPQFRQHVQGATAMLGVLISNPGLQGVDAEGDWWVAVYPHADRDPGVVFAVPASEPDQLEEAVQQAGNYTFFRHEQWVLYTEDEATARSLDEHATGPQPRITKPSPDEQSLALMNRSDLSVFINVPQLRTTYKSQIDRGRQQVEQGLEQFANLQVPASGPVGPVDLKQIAQMYAGMFRGLMQGFDDAEGLAVGLSVGENGVTVEELARFAAGSATDKTLAAHEPSELKRLDSLPADQASYFGGRFNMEAFLSWSIEFSISMYQQDPAKQEKLRELVKQYGEMTYGDFVGSFDVGDAESGFFRAAYLWEVEPAEKMQELAQAFARQMDLPAGTGITMEIDYQASAEEYGERSADVMRMKQTFDPNLDPMGMQQRMMETLFGPEGLTTRVVYMQGLVLQTQGGGQELMTEALNALDAESGALPEPAAATRGQLNDKANFLMLFDVPGIVAKGFVAMANSGTIPVPLDPTPVERLELPRSYAGFSVTTEPQALRCTTYVPVEQVQGMMRLVQTFTPMGSRRAGGVR